MTDLDRAIAAAREALKVKSHPLDSRVTKTLRDLPAALAAAREAHTYVKHLGMTRAEAALGDLIAALDAAQPVAYLWPGSIQALKAGQRPVEALLWTTPTGQAGVPLYLAPKAPPAAAVGESCADHLPGETGYVTLPQPQASEAVVERVARAMAWQDRKATIIGDEAGWWACLPEHGKDYWREMARAAMRAAANKENNNG